MNESRKVTRLERRIAELERRIGVLEVDNISLQEENNYLQELVSIKENECKSLIDSIQDVQIKYTKGLEEIKVLKSQYYETISNFAKMKKEYENESIQLIRRMRKEFQ